MMKIRVYRIIRRRHLVRNSQRKKASLCSRTLRAFRENRGVFPKEQTPLGEKEKRRNLISLVRGDTAVKKEKGFEKKREGRKTKKNSNQKPPPGGAAFL